MENAVISQISLDILPRFAAIAVAASLLASCSGSGEDVRVTLCRDMVEVKSGAVDWIGA